MVLPADKGKATVVMETEGYEYKVQKMLTEKEHSRHLVNIPQETTSIRESKIAS